MKTEAHPVHLTDKQSLFVAEGHRDIYEQIHEHLGGNSAALRRTILPRLRRGNVGLVVYAVCGDTVDHARGTDRPMWAALENLDQFLVEADQPDSGIKVVRRREDLSDLTDGTMRFLIHFEGGMPIEGSIAALRAFYRLGLRSMQIVHNRRNQLGDGVSENATGGGLTQAGRAVVREMERLGMVIDLAHASPATLTQTLEIVSKPIVVSHSNSAAVCAHVRNLSDGQLRDLRDNGALVGVNIMARFVDAERATLDRLVDHVERLVQFLGADRVYLGGDPVKYDGPRSLRDVRYASPDGVFIEGLEEADDYPNLFQALLGRGFSYDEAAGIMGLNLIQYLRMILPGVGQVECVSPGQPA
jgi:membrane dipeptidase